MLRHKSGPPAAEEYSLKASNTFRPPYQNGVLNANRPVDKRFGRKRPPERGFGRNTAARTEVWTQNGRQNGVLDAKRPPELSFGRISAARTQVWVKKRWGGGGYQKTRKT